MITIQLSLTSNLTIAILIFSISIKSIFEDLFKASTSRYQISREKKINIFS